MTRQYSNWTNNRGNSTEHLSNIPPITNLSNGVRYFSAVDGEIYFGDIFIGEVTSIAWNVQQQTMPIFGYNSYTFDDIAVGSRLIQGQFAINFTERNFLTTLQKSDGFRKIARRMYANDLGASTSYTDYRERLHLPMWDKGFDIVIGFGQVNGTLSGLSTNNAYSTYLVLGCVQVTGSTLQLDYNGEPVQEVYTFIARDMKSAFSDESEQSGYKDDTDNNTSTSNNNKELNLNPSIDISASEKQIYISTTDNAKFEIGSVQFSKNFSDKSLCKEIKLNKVEDGSALYATLDKDFILAFKKGIGNDKQLNAKLKYTYFNGNDSYSTSQYVNTIFTIK